MVEDILIVKTTSLGDVVHALPIVSDIRALSSAARIDWVVEQPFADVARLHDGVANVIPVAIRRWRRALWRASVRAEIASCVRRLRQQRYDAIIDAQGLFKSALIAAAAHGKRYGLDFRSSREPLAFFYDQAFRVPWTLHAVERNRMLAAQALGYRVPAHCNYGIGVEPRTFDWLGERRYAVLLHATSADSKLWTERNWIVLGAALAALGIAVVLPWGSVAERDRSERIASLLADAIVPPALTLRDLAGLFAGAYAIVGVDTGLTHLAAALGTPTVGVYCATDPAATGLYGCARAGNLGGVGRAPEPMEVLNEVRRLAIDDRS